MCDLLDSLIHFPSVSLDGFSPMWHWTDFPHCGTGWIFPTAVGNSEEKCRFYVTGWIFPTVARDGRIGEVEKFDWRQLEN